MPRSEQEFADFLTTVMDGYAATTPRSRQTQLGISDVGVCREKARRLLAGIEPCDAPSLRAAEMGIAVHEFVEKALRWHGELITEYRTKVELPNGTLTIPGTVDIIDRDEPSVTDLKTVDDKDELAYTRARGSTDQQRFQRHLCYLAVHQEGLVPVEGLTRNVWLPRAGDTDELVVEQEPFSLDVIAEVEEWLLHVTYAAAHGEEAPRDKPAAWCARFCQFYSDCRNTSDSQLIDDPEFIDAAQTYDVNHNLAKMHESIAAGARKVLIPLQGYEPRKEVPIDGGYLGWVWVNRESNPHYKIERRTV